MLFVQDQMAHGETTGTRALTLKRQRIMFVCWRDRILIILRFFRTVLTIESLTTPEYQPKLCRAPIGRSLVFICLLLI
jgi:hypothetical protein